MICAGRDGVNPGWSAPWTPCSANPFGKPMRRRWRKRPDTT